MKKRSIKLVVSFILAMTMIMGMGMTVMAEGGLAPEAACTEHPDCKHFYFNGTVEELSIGITEYHGTVYNLLGDTEPYNANSGNFADGQVPDEGSAGWYYENSEYEYVQCSGTHGTPAHTHTPVDGWKVTDCGTYHYKSCSGCSEMLDSAEHTFGSDGKCSVCGYSKSGSSSSSSSTPAEPAKTDIEVREALEESMPVAPVSVDMTQFNKADAAVIPGGTYNLSNFVTTRGIVKGINAAVAGSNKAGSNTATIYSGRPLCFNGEIIKAIQTGKKDVVYFFNYKGHLYSVTIPATVDATRVLEKAGFAGPFYVGQQLGTTRLVK